ncbi:hypothetical protein BJ875DRAFT_366029 [Amylocarpus encephaloides]|uniref:Uncharacterized protein n=1 Tax=Amylocarpus encephaloides TaxID=45428 RepID=A0A9P7YT57_9HELO|nr:hypothetical protein BJ875DRAFT_366029 [Amylocarpus encephaloides]
MDPAFIAAQKKHSQPKALGSTSRLRRNPYAQALATPIRICQITRMPLPSFFLQGFKVAAESENEQPYFVPQGTLLKTLHSKRFISQKGLHLGMFGSNTYILARSSMLSGMHGTVLSRLIPTRIGQSKHAQSYRKALYRSDMDRHVLYMVRRSVYYWLLNLHGIGKGYISPYDDFEKAKRYGLKSGLFLWTKDHDRNSDVSPPEFATILTEPKQSRPRKIPVHNLEFLLGETMMSKLREATKDTHKDTFARPILGIKNRNMTVGLELRLWWLQCYLAKHNKILK